MQRLLIVLCAAWMACGHSTDLYDRQDAGTTDDAGSDGDGDGDANTSGDGGSSGDGGIRTGCPEPIVPTQTTTLTGQHNLNDVIAFRAGTRVFVQHSKLPASVWWRWTGSGWSEEMIPWPASVAATSRVVRAEQALDGRALIVTDTHLMTFDGTTMGDVVPLPAVDNVFGYARDPAGLYHVFHAKSESVSRTDGTWDPPAPIPIPTIDSTPAAAATVMANGRIVVVFHDVFFDDNDAVHLYALSRTPGSVWSSVQDLTPSWAVRASRPIVYAPPGGGIVVAANANGVGAMVWRSEDGLAFGASHPLGIIFPAAIAGECLDAVVITAGYQTRYDLFGVKQGAWVTLASRTLNYIFEADVTMLPNGKTYWALGETNWVEYYATP